MNVSCLSLNIKQWLVLVTVALLMSMLVPAVTKSAAAGEGFIVTVSPETMTVAIAQLSAINYTVYIRHI